MLTRDSIQSAVALAQQLATNGVGLLPKQNTPLASLVEESTPLTVGDVVVNPVGGQATIEGTIDAIYCSSVNAQPNTDIVPHTMIQEELMQLVDPIKNHIAFARTVVLPEVDQMVTAIKEQANDLTVSKILGAEVILYSPPAPLINGSFENSLEAYKETNYVPTVGFGPAMPELGEEELTRMVSTGANSFDKDVTFWLTTLPTNFLTFVWQEFFMGKAGSLHNFISRTGYGLAAVDIDRLLAIHLIARNLFNAPIEGTEMSLKQFNATVGDVMNSSGARLYGLNQAYYDETGREKILIRSLEQTTKVVVNASVYKTWISEGGENEVLFGAALNNPLPRSVEVINECKEKFLADWNKHCALTALAEANRRFIRIKDIMLGVFRQQMVDDQEEGLDKESCIKRFKEELDLLADADFDNIYITCIKLLCRARFFRTDSEKILLSIDRVKRENPKLAIREAVTIASSEYIVSWLLDQTSIV